MQGNGREKAALYGFISDALGLLLTVTPWVFDEAGQPLATWSAVFGGALAMRLGFSTALAVREWKLRAQAVVGSWLLAAPWLLHFDGSPGTTCAHLLVGLAAVAAAVAPVRGRGPGVPLAGCRSDATPC
jgi:hypothetical protein